MLLRLWGLPDAISLRSARLEDCGYDRTLVRSTTAFPNPPSREDGVSHLSVTPLSQAARHGLWVSVGKLRIRFGRYDPRKISSQRGLDRYRKQRRCFLALIYGCVSGHLGCLGSTSAYRYVDFPGSHRPALGGSDRIRSFISSSSVYDGFTPAAAVRCKSTAFFLSLQ